MIREITNFKKPQAQCREHNLFLTILPDLHALGEAVVVVLGELDEEVEDVEGVAAAKGAEALEAAKGQLVAEDTGKARSLQLIQLALQTEGKFKVSLFTQFNSIQFNSIQLFYLACGHDIVILDNNKKKNNSPFRINIIDRSKYNH
jgi:hypothetical protein